MVAKLPGQNLLQKSPVFGARLGKVETKFLEVTVGVPGIIEVLQTLVAGGGGFEGLVFDFLGHLHQGFDTLGVGASFVVQGKKELALAPKVGVLLAPGQDAQAFDPGKQGGGGQLAVLTGFVLDRLEPGVEPAKQRLQGLVAFLHLQVGRKLFDQPRHRHPFQQQRKLLGQRLGGLAFLGQVLEELDQQRLVTGKEVRNQDQVDRLCVAQGDRFGGSHVDDDLGHFRLEAL